MYFVSAGAGAKSDPHLTRALLCGPSIGVKTCCPRPCDHHLLQKPHRFAKIVNNSATKTSLAFILDANESPIQDLSFAVPFVSVLQVFFEIRQTEYRTMWTNPPKWSITQQPRRVWPLYWTQMKAPFKAFRLLYHLSQCSKYFLRYRVSRTLCVLGVWEPLPWGGVIWCNLDTVSQRQTPRTPSPHDTLSADVLFVWCRRTHRPQYAPQNAYLARETATGYSTSVLGHTSSNDTELVTAGECERQSFQSCVSLCFCATT